MACNNDIRDYNLMSESFLSTLHKHMDKHHGLYSAIAITNKQIYTETTDRNFHLRKDGVMSYLPKGKASNVSGGKWTTENRQTIKLGKGLKKLFKAAHIIDPIKDEELERIVTSITSEYVFNGTLREVKGKEIVHWYNQSQYADRQHTLSSSCMKYDECEDYIEFYAKNEETVSMIIATDQEDRLIGRAIVWHNAILDSNKNGKHQVALCDRVYGKPLTITAIDAYAANKGYARKETQDYHSQRDIVLSNGQVLNTDITIYVRSHDFYPYMDTMKSIDVNGSTGVLYNNSDHKSLTGTDGNSESMTRTRDGELYNEDECVYSEYYDEYLHENDAIYVESVQTYLQETDIEYLHTGEPHPGEDSQICMLPNGSSDFCRDSDAEETMYHGVHVVIDTSIDCTCDPVSSWNVYLDWLKQITVERIFTHESGLVMKYIFNLDTSVNIDKFDDGSYSDEELLEASNEHKLYAWIDDEWIIHTEL